MSRKTYPVIGSSSKVKSWAKMPPKAAPLCDVPGCGQLATHRVWIEVNWFRGDDERAKACPTHATDAAKLLEAVDARRAAREAQP